MILQRKKKKKKRSAVWFNLTSAMSFKLKPIYLAHVEARRLAIQRIVYSANSLSLFLFFFLLLVKQEQRIKPFREILAQLYR